MRSSLCLVIIAALCTVCILAFPWQAGAAADPVEHVFLISVEGFNYEGYVSAPMNHLKQIVSEGVVDQKSLAIRTDTVEAAQASLLTGAMPEEHSYYSRNNNLEVESLLSVLQKKGKTFLVVDGSGGRMNVFNFGDEKYASLKSNQTDAEVLQQASAAFSKHKPFFTYIYVNDCMSSLLTLDEKEYYRSLTSFDTALGNFVTWLRSEKIYNKSLLVITSPRSSSPSDLVPIVLHGPGCRFATEISSTMVLDTATTICSITGMNPPAASSGVPMYDAMVYEESDKNYLQNKWVADLKKERVAQWNRYYDIQDELYRCIHEMAAMKEDRQSIEEYAGEKDGMIQSLKTRLNREHGIMSAIFILMLVGYLAEYRWLKKKYLLFR